MYCRGSLIFTWAKSCELISCATRVWNLSLLLSSISSCISSFTGLVAIVNLPRFPHHLHQHISLNLYLRQSLPTPVSPIIHPAQSWPGEAPRPLQLPAQPSGTYYRHPSAKPPACSHFSISSALAPLVIFLLFVGGFAFVGYHVWLSTQQISHAAKDKMKKKNVVFSRSGLKVGVKEVRNERYVDKTQSILVRAWNLSTWPGYKSRYWNKDQPTGKGEATGAETSKAP